MARKWRVGILGLGHWYSAYNLARALREYPKAELVAVACPEPGKLAEFARTFGVAAHDSYQALLARDDVDVVHICPPVAEIPECAIGAARAGKAMVLGKPMAMTVAQADAIVEAVRSSGVRCLPFQGVYRLGMAGLRARLRAGLIGEIVGAHVVARSSIAEDWFRSGKPGWFADPRQVPGGAFIDEGIYGIDRLLWLVDSPVVRVEAKLGKLVHRDLPVEDWGLATLTFANGAVGTVEAGWTICSPRPSGPSPKQNGVSRLELIGTRGEVIQDSLHGPTVAILAAGAGGWVFERQAAEYATAPSPGPLGHLVDCLDSGAEPVASVESAREAFVVALAAYEAARTGQPVELARPDAR